MSTRGQGSGGEQGVQEERGQVEVQEYRSIGVQGSGRGQGVQEDRG